MVYDWNIWHGSVTGIRASQRHVNGVHPTRHAHHEGHLRHWHTLIMCTRRRPHVHRAVREASLDTNHGMRKRRRTDVSDGSRRYEGEKVWGNRTWDAGIGCCGGGARSAMRRARERVGEDSVHSQSERSVQQRPESRTRCVDSVGRKQTIPGHDLRSTCAKTAAMKGHETKKRREGVGKSEQRNGQRNKEETNKHSRHCHAR